MSAATISSILIYRQWQPFRDGTYRCSGGRSAEGFDSSIVEITSRDGLRGYGEMAPLGSFYDPSFAEGARAAMRELAFRVPFFTTLAFLYLMIARRGALDGPPGWLYCRMRADYEFLVAAKIKELQRLGRGEAPG